MTPDQMQSFIFQDMAIRGIHIQLNSAIKTLSQRHSPSDSETTQPYPQGIATLLTELLMASALLSANLKIQGRLSVQVRSEAGLLDYAIAECRIESSGASQPLFVKGMARHHLTADANVPLLDMTGGKGILVITIEPDQGQRYQGIVKIDATTISGCIEDYFLQSEQLDTRVHIVVQDGVAKGFMVQRLPEHSAFSQTARQDWELIDTLAKTLSDDELLTLPVKTILHRLFHEHTLELFAPRDVNHQCDCSRERSARAIASLGIAQLEDILTTQDDIVIDCHYCHTVYRFDKVDCHQLLTPSTTPTLSLDSHSTH